MKQCYSYSNNCHSLSVWNRGTVRNTTTGLPQDADGDNILDEFDNCPATPNGPLGGPAPRALLETSA